VKNHWLKKREERKVDHHWIYRAIGLMNEQIIDQINKKLMEEFWGTINALEEDDEKSLVE
jgi:phosphoribosyl-ATP pyrophosphohydrolase